MTAAVTEAGAEVDAAADAEIESSPDASDRPAPARKAPSKAKAAPTKATAATARTTASRGRAAADPADEAAAPATEAVPPAKKTAPAKAAAPAKRAVAKKASATKAAPRKATARRAAVPEPAAEQAGEPQHASPAPAQAPPDLPDAPEPAAPEPDAPALAGEPPRAAMPDPPEAASPAPAQAPPDLPDAPEPARHADPEFGERAAAPEPAGAGEPTLWERLRSDPAHAPEILALAAVEWLGPQAERYTGWARATYPGATDDRLAQAAGRRFAGQARSGALATMIAPEIGQAIALGWLQARLVLHVAAAYGRDPRAPERAAELLVLLRVHEDLASARGALAAAGDTGAPPRRPARRLVSIGARGAGRRLAARLIPGAGILVDLLVNDASMENLARRAISFYRPRVAPASEPPTAAATRT